MADREQTAEELADEIATLISPTRLRRVAEWIDQVDRERGVAADHDDMQADLRRLADLLDRRARPA